MQVEIYSKPNCSYCALAKQVLRDNGISFSENILEKDFTRETLKEKFPSATSYPIIVLDGYFIGGYNQLKTIIEEKNNNSQKLLTE
jgi:glutaredoxin 3